MASSQPTPTKEKEMVGMAVHPPPVSAAAAASAALRDIEVLIGKESESATSVLPTEEGWTVEVEVIDHRHIPPTADMLALYEVVLDLDGEMQSYRTIRRYRRGSALDLSDDEPSLDGDGQTHPWTEATEAADRYTLRGLYGSSGPSSTPALAPQSNTTDSAPGDAYFGALRRCTRELAPPASRTAYFCHAATGRRQRIRHQCRDDRGHRGARRRRGLGCVPLTTTVSQQLV